MTGPAGPLLVCSPLWLEARAVRRGLPGPANGSVRVTGYGPARSPTSPAWTPATAR